MERQGLSGARRVVVKLGTGTVARPDGRLALGRVGSIVEQIAGLMESGRQVLVVSSGAVGLGADRLGLERRPTGVVDRQACAAVGQGALFALYDALFSRLGHRAAQVLLTEGDFRVRPRHVHLAATLERLLEFGVVPVINENDTVSTAEIALTGPTVFGDNDRLSALVATGIGADLLVLLTDVDGVLTGPPGEPGSVRVPAWAPGQAVRLGVGSALGRGGMASKIASAERAAEAGVHAVIARADAPGILPAVLRGDDVGTWFPARAARPRRKSWLALASAPAGRIHVDAGAREAMVRRHASLLARGLVDVAGQFAEGDVVAIVGPDGAEFARGRAEASSEVIRRQAAAPPQRGRPIVHRDHVVILVDEETP